MPIGLKRRAKRGTGTRRKGFTPDNRGTNRLVRSGRLPKVFLENVSRKRTKRKATRAKKAGTKARRKRRTRRLPPRII